MRSKLSISVIAMDYDLNIISEYDSLSKLSRDIGKGHKMTQTTLKILHSGLVSAYRGKLIILKRFYNKRLDFEYTGVAAGLCNKVKCNKQKNANLRLRNNYNRRIAILNHDFTIKEVLMCSMKELAERVGVSETAVKSNLLRAPERIFRRAVGLSKPRSAVVIIHMTKYNNLITRIENHNKHIEIRTSLKKMFVKV